MLWEMGIGMKTEGAIRVDVKSRILRLEFEKVVHECLLVPCLSLINGSRIMVWMENERSR